ncbi:glycosyltransferase [soil metagenome]
MKMASQTETKTANPRNAMRPTSQARLPATTKPTALLHDWLTGFRGGEWILEALCELAPGAPLYTLLHVPGSVSKTIETRIIHTSFLNGIPSIGRNYRKLLPLFPLAAERLKIRRETEIMISSSHCVIKGVPKPNPETFHLSYVHSPMRYMYDQFDSYFGPQSGAPFYQRLGAQAFRPYLTTWDRESNKNVDVLVANSGFVRERIRKFYQRDAEVVFPFVEFKDFAGARGREPKDDFYLMVTAFAPNKRVDLAIAAFNEMKKPLKIIGGGQDEAKLRRMAGPTIEFLGGVSREVVISHMARARAFVFPGVEDFGITPLESLAAGTPVIAFKAGGVLETLTEADAVFFDKPEASSLMAAVARFEARSKRGEFSIDAARLQGFSRERFKREIALLLP